MPPILTNVEEREFEHDIHNLLHAMMAERVMNNDEHYNHLVDASTRLGDHNHKLEGDKFYDLLKDAEREQFDEDETQSGWLLVKHDKLRDVFDMGDASSFDEDEEPGQLVLDDSTDIGVSSWIRNDVDANGLDVTLDMGNENIKEDPINEQNGEDIF
ncbi:hypothetical protein V6N13_136005 [Hibiscus sabdariffa]|uniref:Uncharacterized protein n=2 Tax=Hibiscus sabdariffa TaxID=183260 RepID=A0ABR2QTX1_9ROSI